MQVYHLSYELEKIKQHPRLIIQVLDQVVGIGEISYLNVREDKMKTG